MSTLVKSLPDPVLRQFGEKMNSRLYASMVYRFRFFFGLLSIQIISILFCYSFVWLESTMPISYAFAVLAPPIILLLWACPDIELRLDRPILLFIFFFVTSEIAIPNFYALPVAGVGWINLRKFINLSLLVLSALAYATSPSSRHNAAEVMSENKVVIGGAIAFLVCILNSLPLSSNFSASLAFLPQAITTWYTVLFAILAVPNLSKSSLPILRVILVNLAFLAIICILEYHYKRRVMFDIMPASLIHSLLTNPSFSMLYFADEARSGLFRAVASFSSPLSTGECAAMIMPLALYFAFERENVVDKIIGIGGLGSVLAVLLTANARGALLAAVLVGALYLILVIYRRREKSPASLLPSVFILTGLMFLPALVATNKFRYAVFGGGATAASNDGRMEQLHLAIPRILQSPLWGHGIGTAADVVNFNPGDYVTLDSGMLAVLVDLGLPAFIILVCILFFPAFQSFRSWREAGDTDATLGFYLSLSLISFAFNNFVLAQIENQGLLFLLLSLFSVWRYNRQSSNQSNEK